MIPPTDMATTVFVADDLDAAWAELGPHLLHDVRSYAAINEGNTHTASLSTATTVDELRAEDRTHRIVTVDEAVAMIKAGRAAAAPTARRRPPARDRLALPPHRHRRRHAEVVTLTPPAGGVPHHAPPFQTSVSLATVDAGGKVARGRTLLDTVRGF